MAVEEGVDKILLALNPTGRYQMLMLIIGLLGSIPSASQLLGNVFICEHNDFQLAKKFCTCRYCRYGSISLSFTLQCPDCFPAQIDNASFHAIAFSCCVLSSYSIASNIMEMFSFTANYYIQFILSAWDVLTCTRPNSTDRNVNI